MIRLHSQITTLDLSGFVFAGLVGSVHVPFETATFDYGEVTAESLAQEVEHRDTRSSPLVQTPMTTIARDRSAGSVLASSFLGITEVIR